MPVLGKAEGGVQPLHPCDLVGATRDREAIGEAPARPAGNGPRSTPDRPLHLSADDDDQWRYLPAWIDIPLRPMMTEHPAASAAAVAGMALFMLALVIL